VVRLLCITQARGVKNAGVRTASLISFAIQHCKTRSFESSGSAILYSQASDKDTGRYEHLHTRIPPCVMLPATTLCARRTKQVGFTCTVIGWCTAFDGAFVVTVEQEGKEY
jgi:hypothetical protein